MTFHSASVRDLRLGPLIARGRQGSVYQIAGTDRACAKIYRHPDTWLEARLAAAIAQPPAGWRADRDGHHNLAWPQEVVYNDERRAVGFLMLRTHGVPLVRLYEADWRAEALDDPNWARCVAIARALAATFHALHPHVVVGDVSPNNVMVTRAGRVCLIDCDGMQFRDSRTGRVWPARMATADYAPYAPYTPYAPGGPAAVLSPDHDLFGLAILICELLMAGQHPYDGRPTGVARAEGKSGNIRLGANRVTRPGSLRDRPGLVPVTVLPPHILRLMTQCFGVGPTVPHARPTALMWMNALDAVARDIAACGRSPYHHYPRHLGRCIWCALNTAGGPGDFFPFPVHPPPTPLAPKPRPRAVRKPPPDYGHRPKPGTPPLPIWPTPRRTWRDR